MTIKLMVWNAQHMDNQSSLKHSGAFKEKIDFLDKYLAMQKDIDVLAFLETGKTGNVNQTLENELLKTKTTYVPVGHLAQEGGAFKNTTLGISVYVRSDVESDFWMANFTYVLNHKERRAPVTIQHKSGKYFSFYHANANERTSFGFIREAIQYIKQSENAGDELVLFAGDMNYDYHKMNEQLEKLTKLGPDGPGFTHSKFQIVRTRKLAEDMARRYESVINSSKLKAHFNRTYARNRQEQKEFINLLSTGAVLDKRQATRLEKLDRYVKEIDAAFVVAEGQYDRQYTVFENVVPKESVVVTNRFLDYAFVDEKSKWSAVCHGSISVINVAGVVIQQRFCAGLPMRSDHFPVIYTYADA
ncbi:endonuclease/exonuclease/phosphatase family protein [Trinickia sp. EG282A]|uniref:endonuclease/exonuclease/phosphatase family protein n=1 Tax=Trinickia sp. EG282A TaxID=3237013 RepID=UPI0034D1E14F